MKRCKITILKTTLDEELAKEYAALSAVIGPAASSYRRLFGSSSEVRQRPLTAVEPSDRTSMSKPTAASSIVSRGIGTSVSNGTSTG